MSNRTFVCLDCRISRRAVAVYGKPHDLRCTSCKLGLMELPWERRIPKKDDDRGWKDLRVYLLRLSKPVVAPTKPKQKLKPKGIRSLFQLPARKRKSRTGGLGETGTTPSEPGVSKSP